MPIPFQKPASPLVITVDMEVDRYRDLGEGFIEVWGYVGDYEVMTYIDKPKWQSRLDHLKKMQEIRNAQAQYPQPGRRRAKHDPLSPEPETGGA